MSCLNEGTELVGQPVFTVPPFQAGPSSTSVPGESKFGGDLTLWLHLSFLGLL